MIQFSHVEHAQFPARISRRFQRWVHRILGLPFLSDYRRNPTLPTMDTAYMLLEYTGPQTGTMLSHTISLFKGPLGVECTVIMRTTSGEAQLDISDAGM